MIIKDYSTLQDVIENLTTDKVNAVIVACKNYRRVRCDDISTYTPEVAESLDNYTAIENLIIQAADCINVQRLLQEEGEDIG